MRLGNSPISRLLMSSGPFYLATASLFALCVVSVNYDIFKGNAIEPDRGGLNAHLATVSSLVERGTFVIDDSEFVITLDKMKVGDHYYSDKAPGFGILLAAVYYPLHLLGLSIEQHKFLSASLLTLFGVVLPGVLALALYEKTARLLLPTADTGHIRWSRNLLAFGTLWVTFSGLLNYHIFAGFLLIGATYLLLRSLQDPCVATSGLDSAASAQLLSAAALLGLLYTFDIPTGTIFLGLIGFFFAIRRRWSHLLLWCLGSSGFLLAYHYFAYSITGKLLPPFLYRAEFYQYPGSVHTVSSLTGEPGSGQYFGITHLVDVYRNFFGSVGLFALSPLLLLALLGLVSTFRCYWQRERAAVFRDLRVVLGVAAMLQVLFFNCVVPSAIGSVYGVRHPLPVVPLLIVGLVLFRQQFRFGALPKAVVAISVVFALAGAFQDKQNTDYLFEWKQIVPAYSFIHSIEQYRIYGR